MRRFPVIREKITNVPRSVPWKFVERFRRQAEENHDQTLERLAERGGLSPEEMWYAAHGQRLRVRVDAEVAAQWLVKAIDPTQNP